MVGILKSIFAFFFPKWQPVATHSIHYMGVNGEIAFTMSVTYYTGRNERRKVEFDGAKLRSIRLEYTPQCHPFYHDFIVPFLRKTGDFEVNNEAAATLVKSFCEEVRPPSMVQAKTLLKEKEQSKIKNLSDKAGSNVLPFVLTPEKDNNEPY